MLAYSTTSPSEKKKAMLSSRSEIQKLVDQIYEHQSLLRPTYFFVGGPITLSRLSATIQEAVDQTSLPHCVDLSSLIRDYLQKQTSPHTITNRTKQDYLYRLRQYQLPLTTLEQHLSRIGNHNQHFWLRTMSTKYRTESLLETNQLTEHDRQLFIFAEQLNQLVHYHVLLDNCAIIVAHPLTIHYSFDPRHNQHSVAPHLHHRTKPAVTYPDGTKLYFLNDRQVPAELIVNTHSPNRLNIQQLLQENRNVETRREIINHLGIDAVSKQLGCYTIDGPTTYTFQQARFAPHKPNEPSRKVIGYEPATCEYELLSVNLGLRQPGRALKMTNPSLAPGTYHMEFVPNDTITIQEALDFRNQREQKGGSPDQLT